MRISNAVHESGHWRIREVAADFRLEDAWDLAVEGGADEFDDLLDVMRRLDTSGGFSRVSSLLFGVRRAMGRVLNWDEGKEHLSIPDRQTDSLSDYLPADLRGTSEESGAWDAPFRPVFLTDREFAAEMSNQTVHGVLHLGWVDQGGGRYKGRMAVYVKPRGWMGQGYMALIRPFRHLIVYPALLHHIERTWIADHAAGT